MSTIDLPVVAGRLTSDRLSSYLSAVHGDLRGAMALYDWNTAVGGALHEDIGRFEVVFRNTIDQALVTYGRTHDWEAAWYSRTSLFSGKRGRRAVDDIRTARLRIARRDATETHGRMIAELSFGFWRYLCSASYLTSLWVPVLTASFPSHPKAGDPRAVRGDVEDRVQRIHFLRNRIAHHEPIHHRDLASDHRAIVEVTGWICTDTQRWLATASRTHTVLRQRPS